MSTGAAVVAVLAALERAGAQARPRGELWEFFCPIHADGANRAGELRQGDKGALIVCHAGCDKGLLVERLGLTMADLFDEAPAARTDWDHPDARYVYKDETGEVLYEVRRIGFGHGKQIRPGHYVGGKWTMGLPKPTHKVLYRLPELIEAVGAGEPILICEGERDADTAHALGYAATTNIGGAGKWQPSYSDYLRDAHVVIVCHRDDPGRDHGRLVRKHLAGTAGRIQVVEAAVGNDLADHISGGYSVDDLLTIDLDAIPAVTNGQAPPPDDPDPEPQPDQDIDTFLNEDEPDYDWVIPGLLERGDRVILTGAEGSGKSTLLRQFAIQCGAGIHPFTLESMTPIRVMYVDLENSKRQVRRKIRPLRLVVRDLDPTMIRVRIVTQGIDLLIPEHQLFLEERIKVNAPDLLIMGPLYKLVGDDPVKEEPARVAAMVLDRLRLKYGFALLMEAHSPHGVGASQNRPERPYGASLWMRWPEFGFFIDGETGQLRHWRGPRDERDWPAVLQRGGEWPWTAVNDPRTLTFAKVLDAIRQAGRKLSERELARLVGGSDSQIHRAITANRKQFDEVVRGLGEEEF